MLKVGDPAPEFSLPAHDGTTVTLASLRGTTVVLYFYPKDDTPGCTIESCELRDAWQEIAARGATVFGVSPDDAASHQRFRAKFDLPFGLLCDPDHAVTKAYGAWGEKVRFGKTVLGLLRTTVIIDGEGRVQRVFTKVRPEGHAAEILAALGD